MLEPGATPMTFDYVAEPEDDSPFEYSDSAATRSQITALMDKIVMSRDPALNVHATGTYPCVITVQEQNGKEHRAERLFPPGYSRGGIAEADVVDKFNTVAAALPADQRERIIAAVLELDRATLLEQLTAALRR